MKNILRNFLHLLRQIVHRPNFVVGQSGFDDYWESKRGDSVGILNEFQDFRLKYVQAHLPIGSSVLDIGCGDGAILAAMGADTYKRYGADVSPLALSRLEQQGIEPIEFDIEVDRIANLPKCDYILLLEVLEHISRPERVLLDCIEHADKGVVFSIPNTGHISHRLRLLFGRFPLQWRVHPGEHLRYWTLSDLNWWLNSMNIHHKTKVTTYQGLLNSLRPSLFGRGIICYVETQKHA